MVLVDSLVCLPVPCSRRTLVFSLANTVPGIKRRGGGRSRSRTSSSSSCGRGNGDSSSSCVVVLGVVRSGFAVAAATVAPGLTGKMRKPVVDKAVIVGGGLGGLAAAIQLRKVGIDVQVSWLAGWLCISRQFLFIQFISLYLSVCRGIFLSRPGLIAVCLFRSILELSEISLHWKSG